MMTQTNKKKVRIATKYHATTVLDLTAYLMYECANSCGVFGS